MKKTCLFLVCAGLMLWSCSPSSDQPTEPAENPFFAEFDTSFQTPPFQDIREEHFMPAFLEGMKQHKAEIDAIVNNSEPPTFENTLVAMEYSGLLLDKVGNVFSCLNGAKTNDEIQKIAKEIAPLLSKHSDDINLNEKLFARVKAIYEQKDSLNLTEEQATLLDKYYKGFVRSETNLDEEKKTSLFDQKTAQAFRENILSKGGTADPMTLYKRFRGAEPKVEPLLKRRGLTGK